MTKAGLWASGPPDQPSVDVLEGDVEPQARREERELERTGAPGRTGRDGWLGCTSWRGWDLVPRALASVAPRCGPGSSGCRGTPVLARDYRVGANPPHLGAGTRGRPPCGAAPRPLDSSIDERTVDMSDDVKVCVADADGPSCGARFPRSGTPDASLPHEGTPTARCPSRPRASSSEFRRILRRRGSGSAPSRARRPHPRHRRDRGRRQVPNRDGLSICSAGCELLFTVL